MQASFNNINSWLLIRKYGSQEPIDDKLLKELKEKKMSTISNLGKLSFKLKDKLRHSQITKFWKNPLQADVPYKKYHRESSWPKWKHVIQ